MNNSIKNSISDEIILSADRLVQREPLGCVINIGPVETKTLHYGVFTDKVNSNCLFCLIKFLDGRGVFIRVKKEQIVTF